MQVYLSLDYIKNDGSSIFFIRHLKDVIKCFYEYKHKISQVEIVTCLELLKTLMLNILYLEDWLIRLV